MSRRSDLNDEIVALIAKLRSSFPELDVRGSTFENRDGSIDSEVRFSGFKHSVAVRNYIIDASEFLFPLTGGFFSARLIRPLREKETITSQVWQGNRYVGMVDTHWYRASHSKIQFAVRAAISAVDYGRKSKRLRVETIALRWHWNPTNERPPR